MCFDYDWDYIESSFPSSHVILDDPFMYHVAESPRTGSGISKMVGKLRTWYPGARTNEDSKSYKVKFNAVHVLNLRIFKTPVPSSSSPEKIEIIIYIIRGYANSLQ